MSSPEGKTVEFKRDLSSMKPILKTLVAFVNTAGGYQTPIWEELGTAIRVSFKLHVVSQERNKLFRPLETKELTPRQQKILNFLHKKEPLSAKKSIKD